MQGHGLLGDARGVFEQSQLLDELEETEPLDNAETQVDGDDEGNGEPVEDSTEDADA